MIKSFPEMPAIRQTAIITAIATISSSILAAILHYIVVGFGREFWNGVTFAFLIPWAISIPLGWYLARQNEKLVKLANRLRDTRQHLQEVNKALKHKASFDGLTGLANREHFMEIFDERRKLSQDNVLMIIDADHFKIINDSYGHPVGDKALILFSSVFRRILRKNDIVGRIGGEEFGVLLPDTSRAEGEMIGEMIRYEIENTLFEPQEGVSHRITISIGLTGVLPHEERALPMRNADSALFEAKRRGRNQCVLYTPGMREKPRPFFEAESLQDAIAMPA
ncbi:GGDEF domain-containing protein [Parasphingorhabdus cellanae]|uniref:diguanylate cyclase n=1 Tax=Parasphingorhabdus cellanae TaxID=2806553 RepID=A0ABX7T6J8_9SPHN|nr:GGDEF domain-containing protein [Parasphingorhabdus cellanae]QTD57218.1 GGDEF domain-containing protein [Parasphingorhabdus cellanae]